MRNKTFYCKKQLIYNLISFVFLIIFLSCDNKKMNNVNSETQFGSKQDTINPLLEANLNTFYGKYADSINLLNINSTKLPDFISHYSNDLEEMESTAFHMSKKAVYYDILNLVKKEKLKLISILLANKTKRNETEELVLNASRYLIDNSSNSN